MLLLVLFLPACMPLYVPLVPEPPQVTEVPRLREAIAGVDEEGRPRTELSLETHGTAGWLAVQWMTPAGREAASESRWLDEGGELIAFTLPADVELSKGEWRAVISYEGQLLRQLTITID